MLVSTSNHDPLRTYTMVVSNVTSTTGEMLPGEAQTITVVGNIPSGEAIGNATITNLYSYQDVILVDSPLLYLRVNERSGFVATNLGTAGSGANGTYGANIVLAQPGIIASDPTNDCIYIASADGGSTSLLNTAGSSDLTFECWIKPGPFQNSYSSIIAFGTGFGLFLNGGNFVFYNAGNKTFAPWTASVWTHVVFTIINSAGTHYGRLYLNGALVGIPVDIGVWSASTQVYVGIDGAAGEFFNGYIDEPAVYDHGLAADRVLAHYTAAGY